MFTLASESTETVSTVFSALPERIRSAVTDLNTDRLLELRLRSGGILSAVYPEKSFFINKSGSLSSDYQNAIIVTERDIKRAVELITRFSMYAYENEIKSGYITLSGGHRVGICGNAELTGGNISHLKTVQALNYRFAREIIGISNSVMDKIYTDGEIKNTIIVSPPMCGKTTMLRDIARNLSLLGKRVSIVDERGEIAAAENGCSPFDLGIGCDVLSGVTKSEGMLFMLRSMSPDVIITDEIGGSNDLEVIREIKKRGVSVITTMHGKNTEMPDFDVTLTLGKIKK